MLCLINRMEIEIVLKNTLVILFKTKNLIVSDCISCDNENSDRERIIHVKKTKIKRIRECG